MKTLVLFFSQTGRTKAVAKGIAEALHANIAEITTTQRVIKPLQGGRWKKEDLPIISCTLENLDPFSEIILGGPVWAFNIAPPLLSLVTQKSWEGKKVFLFVTEAFMGGKRALSTLKKELHQKNAHIQKEKIFISLFKSLSHLREQGRKWALTR